jgi:poly(hydroxyalkanoate) depolymerase family esterase
MSGIDWRELYAANRATIARSGIPMSETADAPIPAALTSALQTPARASGHRRNAHANTRGTLLHLPVGLDRSAPAAAICMLHGCTQDPATFAAATAMNDAADLHGFVVVYPGQARANNPQRCWNWFVPEHQRRGAGEPEAIATILRDLIERDDRCTIDPTRVFVAGLSSGGAMAVITGVCYPDLISAVAVHSGLAYRSATDLSTAYQAMAGTDTNGDPRGHAAHSAMGQHARAVPTLVIHGSADRTVAPANAVQVVRQMMNANHLAAPDICNHVISRASSSRRIHVEGQRPYTQSRWIDTQGALMHELIDVEGLGHAWSGGAPGGSYTDPRGPSATEAIWNFFQKTTRSTSADEQLSG